ncbi:hypothetical protein GCM10009836_48170 [Pseudonocardia ailaonensis]|uniref:Membrane fusion protein biotin-lipoyl like domain-containing protein n=1 Tax=Pseudonocardia ailaonensis TaxID=367279 RepID=A0ABN2ND50_9PSEU
MSETSGAHRTAPPEAARRSRFAGWSWKRWLLIGLALAVVVFLLVWFLVPRSSAAAATQLARATTGTLTTTVAATGTIAPAQRSDLSFTVSGQVTAVPVTVGQQVTAGQTLATVDAASLPSQLAQAKASVANAQAKVDSDGSASSAQRNADQAALSAAQAQQAVAERALSQATLTAPFAGTVAAVNVTAGQQVGGGSGGSSSGQSGGASGQSGAASAASASTAGSADVTVISTGTFVVTTSIDDTEVSRVKAGQQAQITPTGATQAVAATVDTVGLVATQTSGVAGYPVTLKVTGDASALHAGGSAQVAIVTSEVRDAVLVPTAAVRQAGGQASVMVDRNGTQVETPVTVGATDGARTQITRGIEAGTQVVVPTGTTGTTGGARFGGFGGGGGAGGFGGGGAGAGGAGGGLGGNRGGGARGGS